MPRIGRVAITLSFVVFAACNREAAETPREPVPTPAPNKAAAEIAPPPVAPPPQTPPPPPEQSKNRSRTERGRGSTAARSPRGPAAGVARTRSDIDLPRPVVAGDAVVPAGRYDVQLSPSDNGFAIALSQHGSVVGSELAVQPTKQPKGPNGAAWLWLDQRQETSYRVYFQAGDGLWFAVFPLAP